MIFKMVDMVDILDFTILAFFDLLVTSMLQIKFHVNLFNGSRVVKNVKS